MKMLIHNTLQNYLGNENVNILKILVNEFSEQNYNILLQRNRFQNLIDERCKIGEYPTVNFLGEIGYLVEESQNQNITKSSSLCEEVHTASCNDNGFRIFRLYFSYRKWYKI